MGIMTNLIQENTRATLTEMQDRQERRRLREQNDRKIQHYTRFLDDIFGSDFYTMEYYEAVRHFHNADTKAQIIRELATDEKGKYNNDTALLVQGLYDKVLKNVMGFYKVNVKLDEKEEAEKQRQAREYARSQRILEQARAKRQKEAERNIRTYGTVTRIPRSLGKQTRRGRSNNGILIFLLLPFLPLILIYYILQGSIKR